MLPFGAIDPSKLDPKTIAALTDLMRELPFDRIQKMQTLMHNSMAGLDVSKEIQEFEQNLPPGFRERLLMIMGGAQMPSSSAASVSASTKEVPLPGSVREARLTVLRAVAEGALSPDDAEKALWPEG